MAYGCWVSTVILSNRSKLRKITGAYYDQIESPYKWVTQEEVLEELNELKLTLAVLGVFFILAFSVLQKAQAQTEISGGGEFFNGDEEITINLDIDHREEFNGWQYVIEGDIYYV